MSAFSLKAIGSIVPADRDTRVNAAIVYLMAEGFHVQMPMERPAKITVGAAAKKLGLTMRVMGRRLRHPSCPPFRSSVSKTGRFLWIILNPALEAFLRVAPKQGSSLEIRASAAGVSVS